MSSDPERRRHEGAIVALAVAALAACGGVASCLLSGYDKVEDGAGGAGGTTASTTVGQATAQASTSSGSAGGEDLPACETTDYPEGPVGAPVGGDLERWFALHVIQLGNPDEPASVPGFDLDRVDTCNDACQGDPECAEPDFLAGLTPEQAQERCDWPDAVDNSSVYLFDVAGFSLGVTDEDLSTEADDGKWSILLRLSRWNGTANDAEVTVGIYSTTGFQPPEEGGTTSSSSASTGSGGPLGPAWDGSDAWGIDSRSLEVPDDVTRPAFQTTTAYVSDGTLVAELGGLFFAGTTRVPIRIASGRLLAPLQIAQNVPTTMRGAVFAGRWPVADLLTAIGTLLIGEGPFCDQTTLFRPVAQRACRLVDVTNTGGLGTCSALSFGIRFDADAVVPGSIVPPTGETPTCPPITCEQLLAEE